MAAAEEAGVKLSCHPNDPPVASIRGCARILVTIEDLERFLDEIPSPANGITFCQGTITILPLWAIRKKGTCHLLFTLSL